MTQAIPYGRQDVTSKDIDAVVEVLRSDFLTQGPVVPRFESEMARKLSARHAVAGNSATSMLHVACLALGVGPGDRVWTSPNTFVASANCALYCGASVDFVDIDPATYNMCVVSLEEKLLVARKSGQLPKVVIPVHFAGQSCDMKAIHSLSKRFDFRVIEDASHAVGGKYDGAMIGCCAYSDITVLSFHPVKIITTAEGGMALTNDAGLARKMERLRSHGITREAGEMTVRPEASWYYEQLELGYNYRMTDLQAALGLSQLERLEAYVERRHQLAEIYDKSLAGLNLQLPRNLPICYSAHHLYVIQVLTNGMRARVFNSLLAAGVKANLHYIPVHLHPYYRKLGFAAGAFPKAEQYYQRAISIPMFATLTSEQQQKVVVTLRQALGSV